MEELSVSTGDFRDRYIISDALLGYTCPDDEIQMIIHKEMKIKGVKSVIREILENKVFDEEPIFMVSVGSYDATAIRNKWDSSLVNNARDFGKSLVIKAVDKFQRKLFSLKKFGDHQKCTIIMCSLIPLPYEQDSDKVPLSEKLLKDLVSRLFVEFNKLINEFNGKVPTPMLKKRLDRGNHHRYVSGQRKIQYNLYHDGTPSLEGQQLIMNIVVNHLRSGN